MKTLNKTNLFNFLKAPKSNQNKINGNLNKNMYYLCAALLWIVFNLSTLILSLSSSELIGCESSATGDVCWMGGVCWTGGGGGEARWPAERFFWCLGVLVKMSLWWLLLFWFAFSAVLIELFFRTLRTGDFSWRFAIVVRFTFGDDSFDSTN